MRQIFNQFTVDLFTALVNGNGDGGSGMRGDETAADHRATPKSGDWRHQVQLGIAWAQLRHLEVANLVLGDETQEFFVSHKFDFVDRLIKVDVNIVEKNVPRFANRFLNGFYPLDNIIMNPENKMYSFWPVYKLSKQRKLTLSSRIHLVLILLILFCCLKQSLHLEN